MKIGQITTPNKKGQIVIPKKMRDKLGIGAEAPLNITIQGNGILIQPIKNIAGAEETGQPYIDALKKTQGSWGSGAWQEYQKTRKKETAENKKRTEAW